MAATRWTRPVAVLGAVGLWLLMAPAPGWSDVILTFTELPNEGGITVSQTGGPNGNGSLGPVFAETVTVTPLGGGFSGLGTQNSYVFNLLEPDGTISDQVIVTGRLECGIEGCVTVKFTSDPAEFSSTTPDVSTLEDGTNQFVGSYLNERSVNVQIFVTSDVDATVPFPATLLLLGAGLVGLGVTTWRRARRT